MSIKYFDLLESPLKGTNLIEASAGTGKTYVIAGLFIRLIMEKALPVDKILAVTYTEAATEELRFRIRDRLKTALGALRHADDGLNINSNDELLIWVLEKYKGNEGAELRLKDGLTRFDEASICTIHGFCRRMLAENAFESSSLFNTELAADQSNLIREIVDDFWRINFYSASPLLIQYAFKRSISPAYFLKLINNLSIDPDLKIIPQLKKPDLSAIEKQFKNAYKDLRNKWLLCKPEIEDILSKSEALNRTKYNPRHIPKWIIEMDNYLSSDNPVMICDKFEKFTSSSISSSIKNGFDIIKHEVFDICEDYYAIYIKLTSELDRYIISMESELFEFFKQEAEKRKQNLNIVTFDDLLVNMRNALAAGEDSSLANIIRSRYSAALIDEFQDTDPVQYEIFNTVFGVSSHVLFLIGDPKQSIYKFRGADIFAYMKASANIQSRYTLGTNWRSSPDLIKAVNTIFKNKKNPFILEEIKFHEVRHAETDDRKELIINNEIADPFHIWTIENADADMKDNIVSKRRAEAIISKAVAGEIFKLISLGREGKAKIGDEALQPGHIAVLVRKRHQARIVQRELVKFGIPSVLYGSESVFSSQEAVEMRRLIAAIADPGDLIRLKAALATDILGLSGNDIFGLEENETAWEDYLNRFYEYHDLWLAGGFFRMFRSFSDNEGIRERALSFADGERRMTNILHLAELMHRAEVENKLGIEGLIKWLEEKLALSEEPEEYEIRIETDEDAVRLITIHRSKGLEFPVVFCPFTWEGLTVESGKPFTFHNPDENFNLTLDIGSGEEKYLGIAGREELAENMRLIYVALTRAKNCSYLFWGRINDSGTSGLSYIFHNKNNYDNADPALYLENSIKLMNYKAMIKDIDELAQASDGAINTTSLPHFDYKRFTQDSAGIDELICRIFNSSVRKDWKISSFSALTYGHRENSESPDYDWVDNALSPVIEIKIKSKDYNIFNFPRGANSGTCIHEIFEKTDFTDFNKDMAEESINSTLAEYGIGAEWQDAVFDMICNVIKTPLSTGTPDLVLNKISFMNRLNELEFYFPLNLITAKGLSYVFRQSGIASNIGFFESLEQLGFAPHRGFIKGYIDMVFQYKDRFYIIDWKSNYLGGNIQDYNQSKIQTVMEDNYYILQYCIYTVALHRFLSARKSGYDYNRHFGGIFYMFVRGVDSGHGIYHDMPSKSIVDSLSNYLAGPVPEAIV